MDVLVNTANSYTTDWPAGKCNLISKDTSHSKTKGACTTINQKERNVLKVQEDGTVKSSRLAEKLKQQGAKRAIPGITYPIVRTIRYPSSSSFTY